MSLSRLTFLYPALLKPMRCPDASLLRSPAQTNVAARPGQSRAYTQSKRYQSTQLERYGSARELPPPPSVSEARNAKEISRDADQEKEEANAKKDAGSEPERLDSNNERNVSPETPVAADEAHPPENIQGPQLEAPERPLEKVLQMPAPSSPKKAKPPHLEAPPYVHHFDTYTLVKDLSKGGFTQDQSITMMKSVRSLLAANLELARDGLVSKSDIENESYLFRAACSELRTEIQNSRKSATEKMRSERALLQHEVDILNQKVTQETANLKDEMKGWFDDRKMAVRMEQRSMESQIQELNYKITVAMSGDSRGEIEGLRWFLTRRAALVIASTAVLILGSLRYATYMGQVQERERKEMAKLGKSTGLAAGSSNSFTTPSRSTGTQTDGGQAGQTEAVLAEMASGKQQDAEVGLVSLG